EQVFAASYLESVAFNPSLSPLQNVLVLLRLWQQPWQAIEEAVLVEKASLGSQMPMSRALLATLGGVELRYDALSEETAQALAHHEE
ncbi:MAG: hypothetical protein KC423_19215, partial [Anaerolineales bacterium]|nr:hypothetical protein [Anaerolineales bacterium]